MGIQLLCRKIGMTRLFDEQGRCIPVTVLEAGPNSVIQKKTPERDGYAALQLGFLDRRPSTLSRAVVGHYEKAGVVPKRHLEECRVDPEDAESYETGQEIRTEIFEPGQHVDVVGLSKGRGYTGVVKRHHFAIKKRTHGTHEAFRHGGSIGAGAYPGKVIKGMGMPGQHGNQRVTTRNLVVVRVDADRNLIYLQGAVPGHRNGLVRVRPAAQPPRG